MKKILVKFAVIVSAITLFTSCTGLNKSMRETNVRVNLTKSDFELSPQVSGEATATKILGIDFKRLFHKTGASITGGAFAPASPIPSIASIPVIGGLLTDATSGYALYELMKSTPGYDVVFYPTYETKVERPIGIGFLFKITTVKVTARLGKFK